MNRYFYILSICFLIISCNQNPSQVEKDYIKNLEEKNKILEKELQELKSKTEPKNISQKSKQKSKNSNDYFTIGSTKDEVLQVQGNPTGINKYESFNEEVWWYGFSTITFKDGLVSEYSNSSRNLKVRL